MPITNAVNRPAQPTVSAVSNAATCAIQASRQGVRSVPVTPREWELLRQNRIEEFWASRAERGDAVALTARQYGMTHMDTAVRASDNILRSAIKDRIFAIHGSHSVYTRTRIINQTNDRHPFVRELTPAGQRLLEQMRHSYRIDLAKAHAFAVSSDTTNVHSALNRAQVVRYHHDTLRQHGLPPSAFAGSWPFGRGSEWMTDTFVGWSRGYDPC